MPNAATATFSGRSLMWARMKGLGTEAKNIGWGASGAVTGSANGNVALFAPATEARTVGSSSLVSSAPVTNLADTYQVTGTLTCAVAAKTITEVGLFDSATAAVSTTLTASLTAGATSMTVGANPGPTSGNYYAQINNETVLVTGAASTTLTIARGQLGTTAAGQAAGSPVTGGGDGGAFANASIGGQTATWGAAQGGDMFIHADFAGVALNVNDSISFTITDTLV